MRTGLTTLLRQGVCRHCGCSHFAPCIDPDLGTGCAWTDQTETSCSVCALLTAVRWQNPWKPVTDPMITEFMPLEVAIAISADAAHGGRLVSVCARCVDPRVRAWLTENGLPNVSHGYCQTCFDVLIAELETDRKAVAA